MATLTSPFRGTRVIAISLAVSVLGAVGLAIGFYFEPTRTLYGYLVAFSWVLSICLGALFLLMIGYAANARWMSVIRRLSDAPALGVVPLALLFVPLALGVDRIYAWARPSDNLPEEVRRLLEHKRPYLNEPFFLARAGIYFAVWILAAVLLRLWSRRHARALEANADAVAALGRERAFSSFMLVPTSLAISFGAFDWLMSLEPTWTSSMFGVYFFAGSFVSGIALVTLLAFFGFRSGEMAQGLRLPHFHALGRLLFAFTIFWAYAGYFQLFLIRIADRPSEVMYYWLRIKSPGWLFVLNVLAIGHFFLPVLLLLPKRLKFRPGYVGAIAAWLLIAHFVDVYWLVMPVLTPSGVSPHYADLAALCAIGGLVTAFCAWAQRGVPLVPERDPFFAEGLHYASHA